MKGIKYLLLICLTVLLTSCASTKKYTAKLESWKGTDVNRLISSWGPPSDVYEMPNRNKMYTWLYVNNSLVTTDYYTNINKLESQQIQYWCKTTFIADTNDVITSWRWNGNSCKSN